MAFSEAARAKYEVSVGAPVTLHADDDAFGDFAGPVISGGRNPVLLVDLADLGVDPSSGTSWEAGCIPMAAIYRLWGLERVAGTIHGHGRPTLTVIVLGPDKAAFITSMGLSFAMDALIEIPKVGLFATEDEAPKVGDFFERTRPL